MALREPGVECGSGFAPANLVLPRTFFAISVSQPTLMTDPAQSNTSLPPAGIILNIMFLFELLR